MARVAFGQPQGPVVTLLAEGGAGICHRGDQVTQVACVTDGRVDALVGQTSRNHKELDAQVAKGVMDIG